MTVPLALTLMATVVVLGVLAAQYPRTPWGARLLKFHGPSPRGRFEPLARGDILKWSALGFVAALALFVVSWLGFSLANRFPSQSLLAYVAEGAGFGAFLLSAVSAFASVGNLFRALRYRAPEALPFAVRTRGDVIGRSAFESIALDDGVVAGKFEPTPAFSRVQDVFRMLAESIDGVQEGVPSEEVAQQYAARRDALGLELVAPDSRIVPTIEIDVIDLTVSGGNDWFLVRASLCDTSTWFDYVDGADSCQACEE